MGNPEHVIPSIQSPGMTPTNGLSHQPQVAASPTLFSCQLRALPEQLRPVRHAITQWAARTGLGRDQVDDLTLAVSEAVTNSIEYAYPDRPGLVWVDGHLAVGQVRVVVSDHGHWLKPTADRGWRGRGLSMIRAVTDHVHLEHDDDATTVTMVWNLPTWPAPIRSAALS